MWCRVPRSTLEEMRRVLSGAGDEALAARFASAPQEECDDDEGEVEVASEVLVALARAAASRVVARTARTAVAVATVPRGSKPRGGASRGSAEETLSPRRALSPVGSRCSVAASAACVVPRVLFTGVVVDARVRRAVAQLGATLVESALRGRPTHVVVGSVLRRTPKLMAAVGVARHAVRIEWLFESARRGAFLAAEPYAAFDAAFERRWGCCLAESLADCSKALHRHAVLRTAACADHLPSDEALGEIVECAGGVWLGALREGQRVDARSVNQRRPRDLDARELVVLVAPGCARRARVAADNASADARWGATTFLEPEHFFRAVLSKRLPHHRKAEQDQDDQPRKRRRENAEDEDCGEDEAFQLCSICHECTSAPSRTLHCAHRFHDACLATLAAAAGTRRATRRSATIRCPLCRQVATIKPEPA